MAIPPQPPMPAISVPRALQAIEDARAELSPRTYAALEAIGTALVSLMYEVDRVQSQVDDLESKIGTLEDQIGGLA